MKKIVLLIIISVCAYCSNAQDLIILRNGDVIKAKIVEETGTETKFKKLDNIDGPIQSRKTQEIFVKLKMENTNSKIDQLILLNATEIKCKITEILPDAIKYKKAENPDGPIQNVKKSEIFMILNRDGTNELLNKLDSYVAPVPEKNLNMKEQGEKDAEQYYNGYHGATALTFWTSLLVPPLGLVPAIACSGKEPSKSNLECPKPELLDNKDYQNAYQGFAYTKKKRRVWKNFFLGAIIGVVGYILLTTSV